MHAIPEVPCQHCPWRLYSPRFAWPVERFNDLRLERLNAERPNAVVLCLCSFVPNNGICATAESPRAEMRPAHTSKPLNADANESFFPSFEAMADANGAGLFDWTAQLNVGDLVVHFQFGVAVGVLEVLCVRNGIVSAIANAATHRFNSLGYEMKSASDSRILPATRLTLESFVSQADSSESIKSR